MSDLNYRSLAKLAYDTYRAERVRSGMDPATGTVSWESLPLEDQAAWTRVVEKVTGVVAAADLL